MKTDVSSAPAASAVKGALTTSAAENALGERVGADTLRFVRRFSAPAERVWTAITTPDGLAAWLGRPIALELRIGGAFAIALSDEDIMDGRVVACEPPHRLAIEWHETSDGTSAPYGTGPGDTSLVTFELSAADGGGTTLVFTHRYIRGGEAMIGFGAGWHSHLDALHAALLGTPPVDRTARYEALRETYAERIGGDGAT